MNRSMLVVLALLATGSLEAQDPKVMAQEIQKLQEQVAALESHVQELQKRLVGFTYTSGNYILNAGAGSVTIKGNAVNLEGATALNFTSGKTIGMTAATNTNLTSGSALNVQISGAATLQAGGQLNMHAGAEATLESDRPLTLKGLGILLQSNNYLTMQGRPITMESTSDITVQAAGQLILKGSKISQN